jgi:hypothetical protein
LSLISIKAELLTGIIGESLARQETAAVLKGTLGNSANVKVFSNPAETVSLSTPFFLSSQQRN